MKGVTSGIPKRSKEVVEGALLRSLMYRPAARVAAIFDIILVILCTAFVAFATVRIIGRVILPDGDKAVLFLNKTAFGNRSDFPVDLDPVDQCKRPRADIYSALEIICTLLLCYITVIILPLYAAFGLLQSTIELSDMDLKRKLMHVLIWISYSLASLVATMVIFGIYGFPQCEVALIGIAVFRLLFVFFVMKYAYEMKEAVDQVEKDFSFIPGEPTKVLIEGKK